LRANLQIRKLEKDLADIKANDSQARLADEVNSLKNELSKVSNDLEQSQ